MDFATHQEFLSHHQLQQIAADYARDEQESTLDLDQWLIFSLGNELFTLSMNELDQVANVSSGIAVPAVSSHILGLITVRGEPLILVDMGQALGLRHAPEPNEHQRVLVLKDDKGQAAGFLVDAIIKVTDLSDWQKQSDQEHQQQFSHFVEAISDYNGRGVSRLCPSQLLNCIKS